MFLQGLGNGLFFLISLIFDFYVFILIFRFILQKCYANYHNPITQFILKITNPPLKPLQKIIPGIKGFDLAIIFLALVIVLIEAFALVWLEYHAMPHFLGLLIASISMLFEKVLNLYFFCVIIGILLSWIPRLEMSPMAEIIHRVIDPVMHRVRRIIPPIGGLDLTPIPVLIAIKLIEIMLFDPLTAWGLKLAVLAPN